MASPAAKPAGSRESQRRLTGSYQRARGVAEPRPVAVDQGGGVVAVVGVEDQDVVAGAAALQAPPVAVAQQAPGRVVVEGGVGERKGVRLGFVVDHRNLT